MALIEIGAGSVQSWECDSNGHFNVQYYVGRAAESLAVLGVHLGIGPRHGAEHGEQLRALDHHVRFLREMRPGAPFILLGGIVGTEAERLTVYQELRNTASGEVCAAFVTEAALLKMTTGARRTLPREVIRGAAPLAVSVPEHGRPKGLVRDAPRPPPRLDETERLGLVTIHEGVVAAAECDEHGWLTTRGYMARVSDGVPNLVARTRGDDRSSQKDDRLGGAALEYRFVYRAVPRTGDVLVLRSGVKAVGGKTTTWTHWMFDRESGACVATAESVVVTLDLATRKAVEIPPEARRRLERHVVPGITV